MIKAVNLNKTYYQGKVKIEAVKNVGVAISTKDAALITGPSGAGKSTLLHLLGGLDRPTMGTLFFDGVDFYGLPDRDRSRIRNEKIGFVFQFYNLLPEFTVLENVILPALINRKRTKISLKKTKEKARHLLGMVGLTDRINHRPSELSGGESQRAAIARSLINSPKVLMCDEPTGNLDSKIGQDIMESLWRLKEEENMALVIVTHNEHIHDGFSKKFRIKDGMVEEISDGSKSLPKWEACRQK